MSKAPAASGANTNRVVPAPPELEAGVAVVIPVHNRRSLVCDAIDSALDQGGVDVEVIVVDDASTDGTAEAVRTRYAGRPVRVLDNDRARGPAGARNCGLESVRRRFTAFLDSDDLFLPGHLAACVGVMERHAAVDVVFGPARYDCGGEEVDYMKPNYERKIAVAPVIRDDGEARVLGSAFLEHLIRYGCFFNLSSVAIRTAAVPERMNERLRIAEDYEYWMRLAYSHAFACLVSPQIVYRVHDQNVSLAGDSSDDDHSSSLIRAYEAILECPDLSLRLRRVVHARMAQVLFDWGYHARRVGHPAAAVAHHLASFGKGMRLRNIAALIKTILEMSLGSSRKRN